MALRSWPRASEPTVTQAPSPAELKITFRQVAHVSAAFAIDSNGEPECRSATAITVIDQTSLVVAPGQWRLGVRALREALCRWF